MPLCAISLGGNVGDVPGTFAEAVRLLASSGKLTGLRISRSYRTAAMGASAGDVFHNAAAAFETALLPLELLDLLQQIEQQCGRVRTVQWGPRTLDLDLLLYGDEVIGCQPPTQSPPSATAGTLPPRLIVPHPALYYRRFVLDPLVELMPDVVHPVFQLTIRQVRQRLLIRPLPVKITKPAVDLWTPRDFESALETPILFAPPGDPVAFPHQIGLPHGETNAAQLVIDVLTAALDEPVPL